MFADCHDTVFYQPFYEKCLEAIDQHGCKCNDVCDVYAEYAAQCNANKMIDINWRAIDFCPLMCEELDPVSERGSEDCLFHHDYCIPVCFDTCGHRRELSKIKTLQEYEEVMNNCERPACYEGCAPRCCDEEVYDEKSNSCIPHAECPRPQFHPNFTSPIVTTSQFVKPTEFTRLTKKPTQAYRTEVDCYSAIKNFGSTPSIWSFLEIFRMIFWPKIILKISKNDQISGPDQNS